MDEDSTTANADNQDDASKGTTVTDPNKATDSKTADDKTASDNLDTSKKSDEDTSAAGDDKKSKTDETNKDTSTPKFDTDLDEWAEKTNRAKPTTDRERELYQEIRDGQREFSRGKQAKDATQSIDKAIEKATPADNKQVDDDDEEDPVAKDVAELKRQNREERSTRLRGEYFTEKSVSQEESDTMGAILQEKVDKAKTPEAKQQVIDYWTNPEQLEDWHMLAKARLNQAGTDTTVIEEEAARKERERIAKESHSGGGNRNASKGADTKPKGYNRTEFLKSDD